MKLPIQYALGYPKRLKADYPRFNFLNYPALTFEQPDRETFRNLDLAFEAMRKGGTMPCILNAANEVAVAAFLNDRIGFLAMSDLLEHCMQKVAWTAKPSYEEYVKTDIETRRIAEAYL
jgi:1-deoxy-D-xylulose-5-phosphate reductoisomerase